MEMAEAQMAEEPQGATEDRSKTGFAERGLTEETGENQLDVAIDSPAIRRLIDEVQAEETGVPRSYNRTFNRHNR